MDELLDSILAQTYGNFEVCLADGSTGDAAENRIREKYASDPRILYQRLSENKGISENTNAAVGMAHGEFIMLCDHVRELERCLNSIREKSKYPDYDIVIIENNSTEEETFRYYEKLKADSRIRIERYEGGFNYSAINNFGAQKADGEYLFLLNNDTEFISPDVMEQLLGYAMRPDTAAAGARLYYEDDTIQHADRSGSRTGCQCLERYLYVFLQQEHDQ